MRTLKAISELSTDHLPNIERKRSVNPVLPLSA